MNSGELFTYGFQLQNGILTVARGIRLQRRGQGGTTIVSLPRMALLAALTQGGMLPQGYDRNAIFRERIHFTCAITDI